MSLSIRYNSYSSNNERQEIAGFSIGSRPWQTSPETDKPLVILCTCGANNWTDNGRTMNEYECDCCGEYILTEPKGKVE